MEAQRVEAYKLNDLISTLHKESGKVPLQWSWENIPGGIYHIRCKANFGDIEGVVDVMLSDDFIAHMSAGDLVFLVQSEFANKIGKMLVCPNRD